MAFWGLRFDGQEKWSTMSSFRLTNFNVYVYPLTHGVLDITIVNFRVFESSCDLYALIYESSTPGIINRIRRWAPSPHVSDYYQDRDIPLEQLQSRFLRQEATQTLLKAEDSVPPSQASRAAPPAMRSAKSAGTP